MTFYEWICVHVFVFSIDLQLTCHIQFEGDKVFHKDIHLWGVRLLYINYYDLAMIKRLEILVKQKVINAFYLVLCIRNYFTKVLKNTIILIFGISLYFYII